MRRVALIVVLCLVGVACSDTGAVSEAPRVVTTTAPLVSMPTPTQPPTTTTTSPVTTSTEAEVLDVESLPTGTSLVLGARDQVPVYAEARGSEPFRTLEPNTILGTTTVLTVLDGPRGGWARVMLPGRPNGSEGWVQTDNMMVFTVKGRVVVDLSDRTLTYQIGNAEILATPVGVGTTSNPTPTGSFFVTDSVTMADPNSSWGPHALGLSARSETITEYNGGDGIIGIHGTNSPSSIGQAASMGCVRVPNEVIARLHRLVSIGTPVDIRA